MSMAAGLSIAFLKIVSLALVVIMIIWAVAKSWLLFYKRMLVKPIWKGARSENDT
jgi:hypothetical protein